jgi:hypothetical protein
MSTANKNISIDFTAKLLIYNGISPWYFVNVPKEHYDTIKNSSSKKPRRGFGAVKIKATIGETSWETSVFPDSRSKTYLMPIKKDIRHKENLYEHEIIAVHITLLEHI